MQEFQPDLIHAVNPFFLGPFGFSYARRLGVPIVASYHTNLPHYAQYYHLGLIEPLVWRYILTWHNNAYLNLCHSTATLKDLREHGFERVRWWKRGIDTERFSPGLRDEAVRARLTDGHPNDFLVINVGRHAVEKRLEMMRDPLFKVPGVRLAMVGNGPHHAQLKKFYHGTPTVWTGPLHGDDLVAAYRAADAFLFPSTTETFGLVALEAMGCRVPVIAARFGGVVDIVNEGVNGLYFEPSEPERITDLVTRLRDNPALRDELAQNALLHAHSCSWQATMDQLIDYYYLALRLFQRTQFRRRTVYPI